MNRLHLLLFTILALAILIGGCESPVPPGTQGADDQAGPGRGTLSSGGVQLSGAIFTTTVDGGIVNENVHYEAKEDVYLDGGPGPNAPATAAGLPEGDYYFQVPDPSGKDLLSSDHISCRMIHVNEYGVIDQVYAGTNYEWQNGQNAHWEAVPCQHAEGVDQDHSELGAITVQLFPYDDTPNPGGVYKVWITRVEDYAGDPNYVPQDKKDAVNGENYQPANYHGFIPSRSKTDNYKVKKQGKPCDVAEITLKKFHDANGNGIQDAGEEDVIGWEFNVTDPTGVTNIAYSGEVILAPIAGVYEIDEANPAGTVATTDDPVYVTIVDECGGEDQTVVFGNVGLGSITACKYYDRDGDGVVDEGEPAVAGITVELSQGGVVVVSDVTGESGCVTFGDLMPGTYTVTEILPTGWVASGPTSYDVTITSTLNGAVISGTTADLTFTNYCEPQLVGFNTKGYWHNKNGLVEIMQSEIDYVNGLAPYSSPSPYFGDGDEPFDGFFEDGTTQVQPAIGDGIWQGEEIAPAGSPKAEISQFLVDQNAGSSENHHIEQLAQQLLAFIFNTFYRLDDPNAAIQMPDGTFMSASDLVAAAIAAWQSGDPDQATYYSGLLDGFNNSHCDGIDPCVVTIPYNPCPVVY